MTEIPVDNPRYAALRQAQVRVEEHVARLRAALDEPFELFSGDAVWIGPVARRFGEELGHHRRRLRQQAETVLAELEAEIRRTPQRVSPAVAREEAARLSGRPSAFGVL
ncbi:hypothetical protein [Nonomuraea gerenzanensis]|uniref:Uncharacterized protein n=1 Tax=Nonomuraea gerenzanensis TaxID=93944 RepID=A0A1M4EBB2_9ACTN|nr:hypothetical protein [Nonomuraea gerenzanensis]UBU18207.1 hypothetical protein LCN96_25235 [Nonomuraea gerenzanensis]SBO96022.1 hypothetical protein BN4615_P5538 [Nonomuraea gerenzanensis]